MTQHQLLTAARASGILALRHQPGSHTRRQLTRQAVAFARRAAIAHAEQTNYTPIKKTQK